MSMRELYTDFGFGIADLGLRIWNWGEIDDD
jgi:hypothetical protein